MSTSSLSWFKSTSMRSSYSSARVCLFASLKKVEVFVLVVDFCVCCYVVCSKWLREHTKASILGKFRMQIVK